MWPSGTAINVDEFKNHLKKWSVVAMELDWGWMMPSLGFSPSSFFLSSLSFPSLLMHASPQFFHNVAPQRRPRHQSTSSANNLGRSTAGTQALRAESIDEKSHHPSSTCH